MNKIDELSVRYVKCTFCGWNHSYDASVVENVDNAWRMANNHAMECEADPRNIELSTLRERVEALRIVTYAHAFKTVLSMETGHTYLRCHACNASNESKIRNNLNPDEVNHYDECTVAAALQAP